MQIFVNACGICIPVSELAARVVPQSVRWKHLSHSGHEQSVWKATSKIAKSILPLSLTLLFPHHSAAWKIIRGTWAPTLLVSKTVPLPACSSRDPPISELNSSCIMTSPSSVLYKHRSLVFPTCCFKGNKICVSAAVCGRRNCDIYGPRECCRME